MAIFNKNIFEPKIFHTDAEESSDGTNSSVVEKKKGKKGRSHGRSYYFKKYDSHYERRVLIKFDCHARLRVRSFAPFSVHESLPIRSIDLDEFELDMSPEALVHAASVMVSGARQRLEKPSLPQVEPSLYGDVPIDDYGEVEFQVDRKSHSTPDECDDYNGQVFSYGPDGLEDGAPNPPLHPHCSCKLIDTKTKQVMYFPGSEFDIA